MNFVYWALVQEQTILIQEIYAVKSATSYSVVLEGNTKHLFKHNETCSEHVQNHFTQATFSSDNKLAQWSQILFVLQSLNQWNNIMPIILGILAFVENLSSALNW